MGLNPGSCILPVAAGRRACRVLVGSYRGARRPHVAGAGAGRGVRVWHGGRGRLSHEKVAGWKGGRCKGS